MRRDSSETKRKILTVCVRLFLEQGYKSTSVSQIVDEAGVARGSYLNLFPTKDKILLDLTETMFGGQFGMARSIADTKLPPVYAYAVETAIQLTLTELNENLREIYIEAYSLPDTAEYIYLHTTAELKQIFGENLKPPSDDSDFSCLVLTVYKLTRNDFYSSTSDIVHSPNPQHLVFRFEGFRYALLFGKLLYQPRKQCFCLLVKVCKICGKPFWPSNGQEVLCSEECKAINRRQKQLAYYHRKQSEQKAGEAI